MTAEITDAPNIFQEMEDEDIHHEAMVAQARASLQEQPEVDEGYPPVPDDNPKTIYGEAKPKLSDVPMHPVLLMGQVFSMGRAKYGRYNWRMHHVSSSVYFDAAMRHLIAWFEGEDIDPESGLPHTAHVMACMAILLDAENRGTLNDNRGLMEDHRV